MTKLSNHPLGVQWRLDDYLVFFGNQQATSAAMESHFPHFDWRKIQQVHGSHVVPAQVEVIEADAHFSDEVLVGLQIRTADCLPIFIVDQKRKEVMGIHAGWRGVASQITSKALLQMLKRGGRPEDMRVIIGPHIRKQSFEVDEPVWVQLMDAVPVDFNHQLSNLYHSMMNGKFKIDLEGIVRAQILDQKIPANQIDSVEVDTLSDGAWHSYRRDREQSGRNISFISRLK